MLYTLDLGATEQSIARQAAQSGQPLPDRIANAPELHLGLAFYLQAFFDLDSERSVGFGMGRIPISAVQRYAKHYELGDEQTECLTYFIRALDTAYLQRADSNKSKTKGSNG